jgi:hypothetical protein
LLGTGKASVQDLGELGFRNDEQCFHIGTASNSLKFSKLVFLSE